MGRLQDVVNVVVAVAYDPPAAQLEDLLARHVSVFYPCQEEISRLILGQLPDHGHPHALHAVLGGHGIGDLVAVDADVGAVPVDPEAALPVAAEEPDHMTRQWILSVPPPPHLEDVSEPSGAEVVA